MTMTRRQKVLILILAVYWPVMFILTHIPIPEVVRAAHMSDKSLHLLTYMILTFLLWSALRPFERANWRRPAVWCVALVVMAYGLCDEYLQHFVAGRSADPEDLVANAAGILAGLTVTAVMSFWPGALIVTGTTIYTLAVFTRANLTRLLPVTSTALHLATYGLFALLWIGWTNQREPGRRLDRRWLLGASTAPGALLLVTTISAVVSGREFEGWEMVAGAGGIVGAIGLAALWRAFGPRGTVETGLSPAETSSS